MFVVDDIHQTPRHHGRARAKVYEESAGVALQEDRELEDGREAVSEGRDAFRCWSRGVSCSCIVVEEVGKDPQSDH